MSSYPEEKASQPGTEATGAANNVFGNEGAAAAGPAGFAGPQGPWWANYPYGPAFAQPPQQPQAAAAPASAATAAAPAPQPAPQPPAWGPYMGPPPGYWGHGHHHHGHGWGYPGMVPPQWAGFPPVPIAPGPWGGYPPAPIAPAPGAGAPGTGAAGPLADHPHYHGLAEAALNLNDNAFVKGLLIGAGATFLLTNDTVQRNIIAAAVKLWSTVQGGVEEMKERFRDAEAELHAAGEEEG